MGISLFAVRGSSLRSNIDDFSRSLSWWHTETLSTHLQFYRKWLNCHWDAMKSVGCVKNERKGGEGRGKSGFKHCCKWWLGGFPLGGRRLGRWWLISSVSYYNDKAVRRKWIIDVYLKCVRDVKRRVDRGGVWPYDRVNEEVFRRESCHPTSRSRPT